MQQAQDAYEEGQTALQNGDWAAYGEAQARLEEALNELEQLQSGDSAARNEDEEQTDG